MPVTGLNLGFQTGLPTQQPTGTVQQQPGQQPVRDKTISQDKFRFIVKDSGKDAGIVLKDLRSRGYNVEGYDQMARRVYEEQPELFKSSQPNPKNTSGIDGPLQIAGEIVADIPETIGDITTGIKESAQRRFRNLKGIVEETKERVEETREAGIGTKLKVAGQTGLRFAGQAAGFLGDVFGELFVEGLDLVTPEEIENVVKEGVVDLAQTDMGQKGLAALKQGINEWKVFKRNNPQAAQDIEAVVNIAEIVPVGKILGVAGKGARRAKAGLRTAGEALPTPTQLRKAGLEGLERARARTAVRGEKLTESALQSVEKALGATTKKAKAEARRVAPGVLERGLVGSRETLKKRSEIKISEFGEAIGDFIEERGIKGSIEKGKLIDALDVMESATKFEGGIINEARFNAIQQFKRGLEGMDIDIIEGEKLRTLRRMYDDIVKQTGGFGADEAASVKNEVSTKLGNIIRDEIAKNNPDLAKLNAEFSFWKGLDDVLDKTIKRTAPQSGIIKKLVPTALAFTQPGFAASLGSYLGSSALLSIMTSPYWRLVSAKLKNKFARLLGAGNIKGANSVIRDMNKEVPALNMNIIK